MENQILEKRDFEADPYGFKRSQNKNGRYSSQTQRKDVLLEAPLTNLPLEVIYIIFFNLSVYDIVCKIPLVSRFFSQHLREESKESSLFFNLFRQAKIELQKNPLQTLNPDCKDLIFKKLYLADQANFTAISTSERPFQSRLRKIAEELTISPDALGLISPNYPDLSYVDRFITFIKKLPTTHHLDCSTWRLQDSLKILISCQEDLKELKSLKLFGEPSSSSDLYIKKFNDEDFDQFTLSLPSLENLNIFAIHEEQSPIFEMCLKAALPGQIKTLSLDITFYNEKNFFTPSLVETMEQFLPSLTSLTLIADESTIPNDDDVLTFVNILKTGLFKNLELLHIRDVFLGEHILEVLDSQFFPKLKELNLSCETLDKATWDLISKCGSTLNEFSLTNQVPCSKFLSFLNDETFDSVKNLRINFNISQFFKESFNFDFFEKIITSRHIHKLNIWELISKLDTAHILQALSLMAKQNEHIPPPISVNLSHFNSEVIIYFLNHFDLSNLKCLSFNRLSSKEDSIIETLLEKNLSLDGLSLSFSNFTLKGLEKLFSSPVIQSLNSLEIVDEEFDEETFVLFANSHYLKYLHTLSIESTNELPARVKLLLRKSPHLPRLRFINENWYRIQVKREKEKESSN